MDLGSCPRTHSVKVKNEYEAALAKATADQDETKIAQLNQLKIDYELVVRTLYRGSTVGWCSHPPARPRSLASWTNVTGASGLRRGAWRRHRRRTIGRQLLYATSGLVWVGSEADGETQMREIGELEGAYQAAMADVEQLGESIPSH